MPAQISYFTELIGFDVEPAVHYKCSYVMKCSGLSYSCHNPMCQGADTICILVRCHKFDKMGVLEPWQSIYCIVKMHQKQGLLALSMYSTHRYECSQTTSPDETETTLTDSKILTNPHTM